MAQAEGASSLPIEPSAGRPATDPAIGYRRLLALLSESPDEAGRHYEALRRRLIRLLGWRGAAVPEDLADETLDRVARQLGRGVEIQAEDPFRYVCGVAFRVLQESIRSRRRDFQVEEGLRHSSGVGDDLGEAMQETRVVCLEQCLEGLDSGKRDLILGYYQGERREKIRARRDLAERLGIRAPTLRLRALRIRETLETCVVRCLKRSG